MNPYSIHLILLNALLVIIPFIAAEKMTSATSLSTHDPYILRLTDSIDSVCHVIMYLMNVELELALVAIQKCLVLLHDYLGPNTKKLWLHTHIHTHTHRDMTTRVENKNEFSRRRISTSVWFTRHQ